MRVLKKKAIERVEVGGFIAEWYFKEGNIKESYLEISTVSGIWSMRVDARCNAYGYLLESARQGKTENIHGYAALLYITAQQLTQEQGFCDDITRSVQKWQKRMEERLDGSDNSDNSDKSDLADEALMREVAAYADASPKERKKLRKQWKEEAREVLRQG